MVIRLGSGEILMAPTTMTITVLTPEELRAHWQGHRRVTRRVLEAFPEDKLFTFSIGGMRPFGEMIKEFLYMTEPIAKGVATGVWEEKKPTEAVDKAALLAAWDEDTAAIDRIWPTIAGHRWEEMDMAFGKWPGRGIDMILYAIDNEVHHRGQGYVYLRALGVEPPAFYSRE